MTETVTIPLVEEEISVSKRKSRTGRVRVETRTEQVDELVGADLASTEVEVERVPIGREVDRAPEIRTEGDVTIVPVLEEVLVVEKRLVLKEELHIRRRVTTGSIEIPISVKKQRAVISAPAKRRAHRDRVGYRSPYRGRGRG